MECLVTLATAASTDFWRPSLSCSSMRNDKGRFRAKLSSDENDDPLYQAAISRSSLRYQETHRPEPLFIDPYAGCFIHPNMQMNMKHQVHHHCLATKFIDDKLLSIANNIDGLKQVVLLTDGMDTRPYRLKWPPSTIVFDISPERIFQRVTRKLEDVGAKIPRSCLFLHVPLESSDIQEVLCSKGFTGNRPSIWAIQGLPVWTLAYFKDILSMVGNLAMKGCPLFGELPAWLAETEVGIKTTKEKWMEKLFRSNGFQVNMIDYVQVARNLHKQPVSGHSQNILFVAEHLLFSDDQMETWRREFQRIEDEGDEEGFEEL